MTSPISAYRLNPYAAQARTTPLNIKFGENSEDPADTAIRLIKELEQILNSPETPQASKDEILAVFKELAKMLDEATETPRPAS